MSVKIVVACGSGIATSTVVEQKLKDIVSDNNLDVNFTKTSISSLEGIIDDFDLAVVTSKFNIENSKTEVLSATSLLTGIGEDEFVEKFVNKVKNL
ncbi:MULTISPECIES: PTS galactitol transporter subunit IIB [Anaerofustis]|uniref:PTS galactitol transporter subunit IIB n=1 Tax=Anaerofustis TaxID=264995 RepID=UPI00110600DD|nr:MULTISPECIES: PTS galactitol transporter subunit IIB [Anaerofustis]MCO8193696.1 PTS galactitol transporter subunit IIB [Anaerofustis sp. NSJ-163]